MDAGKADVFQTVEYSRDRRTMDTMPCAFLVCLLGLVLFTLYPNPSGPAFLRGFVLLFGLGVSLGVIGFLFTQAFDGRTPAIRILGIVLVVIYVGFVVASYWDRPGDFFKPTYRRVLGDTPPGIVGSAMVVGAIGWIAVVLYRHFRPAAPILTLSPAGIFYRANGIRNLLIPWHEIQGVDCYEADNIFTGLPQRVPDLTAVLVSREFYERNILPQRSVWDTRNRNWDFAFRPKGALVQIQLSSTWFSVDPRDIREPVEARWKAFRDTVPPSSSVPSVAPRAAPRGEALVYGRWSIDGSLRQAVKFFAPLVGIAAVLVWMGWPH